MGNRIGMMATTFLSIVLLPGSWAWSQTAPPGQDAAHPPQDAIGTVSGQGQVTLRPLPTAVQLHLKLSVKGKSVEEAVARLKQRQQAASAELEKLGASKKSIHTESLSVAQSDSAQHRLLQQMIRQRVRGAGPAKEMPKVPKTVAVTTILSAEFPLTAKDADAAFLAAHRLQEQVKAAKLAGSAEDEKLSAEDDEASEESGFSPGGEQTQDPNTPTILYLARISKDAQAKAMAESFQKAKQNAVASARAAGRELGALVTVQNHLQATQDRSGFNEGYRYSTGISRPGIDEDEEGDEPREAQSQSVSNDLGKAAFQFTTMAVFRIDAAAKAKNEKRN